MPLQATSGAASYDAFGGGAAAVIPYYIEDMFSCFLYTGNATARSIVNNIDISGNGGLVWTKSRSLTGSDHFFVDTDRGATKFLNSNSSAGQVSTSDITAFNSTGYALNSDVNGGFNNNGATFASWTFRKQPKFFDIVTYTGDGSALKTISHNLGSVPGCIIVKSTSSASWNWTVYHRSLGISQKIQLNLTDAAVSENGNFGGTSPTSTAFSVGYNATNESGGTYVAYLFAHNAGGFGASATDNVISCGSFTTDGSGNATVSLGYEPQWVLIKRTNGADSWYLNDNMRGMAVSGNQPNLSPNLSAAESAGGYNTYPNATGFTASVGIASAAHIYIAIRRGPMKTPTLGTSVFSPSTRAGTGATATVTGVGFAPDVMWCQRTDNSSGNRISSKLRGVPNQLMTFDTVAEQLFGLNSFNQDGVSIGTNANWNSATGTFRDLFFQRAPSFFDEVCWTTTQTGFGITAITHNLNVVPELIITKARNTSGNWMVRVEGVTGNTSYLRLNSSDALTTFTLWGTPTTTTFSEDEFGALGSAGTTAVAYLFATCAGVSKVGSYTGTGSTQTINCGFTAGSRFVLIKRTDSTGDWYVWDSARGIVSGNDPYLLLNSSAAEMALTDFIDPVSTGFELSSTALATVNVSGGTYIFLAIA
jgi:hypothetical protein